MAVENSARSLASVPQLVPLGAHLGKPGFAINRPAVVIGSRADARIHLQSSTVSMHHALLVVTREGMYVRDLASRTHTIVNGRPVVEAVLHDGDQLQIGRFTFRYVAPKNAPAPAPRAAHGVLDVEGEDVPLPIDGRVVVIGRRLTCDITLTEESASTTHAIIFEKDGERFVRDLASRTGTFVNGRKIHQEPLRDGDVLRCGDTEIAYLSGAGSPLLDEPPQISALPDPEIPSFGDDILEEIRPAARRAESVPARPEKAKPAQTPALAPDDTGLGLRPVAKASPPENTPPGAPPVKAVQLAPVAEAPPAAPPAVKAPAAKPPVSAPPADESGLDFELDVAPPTEAAKPSKPAKPAKPAKPVKQAKAGKKSKTPPPAAADLPPLELAPDSSALELETPGGLDLAPINEAPPLAAKFTPLADAKRPKQPLDLDDDFDLPPLAVVPSGMVADSLAAGGAATHDVARGVTPGTVLPFDDKADDTALATAIDDDELDDFLPPPPVVIEAEAASDHTPGLELEPLELAPEGDVATSTPVPAAEARAADLAPADLAPAVADEDVLAALRRGWKGSAAPVPNPVAHAPMQSAGIVLEPPAPSLEAPSVSDEMPTLELPLADAPPAAAEPTAGKTEATEDDVADWLSAPMPPRRMETHAGEDALVSDEPTPVVTPASRATRTESKAETLTEPFDLDELDVIEPAAARSGTPLVIDAEVIEAGTAAPSAAAAAPLEIDLSAARFDDAAAAHDEDVREEDEEETRREEATHAATVDLDADDRPADEVAAEVAVEMTEEVAEAPTPIIPEIPAAPRPAGGAASLIHLDDAPPTPAPASSPAPLDASGILVTGAAETVLEPTEPTPESAFPVEVNLAGDTRTGMPAIDPLTDTQFARSVREFADEQTGDLIEAAPVTPPAPVAGAKAETPDDTFGEIDLDEIRPIEAAVAEAPVAEPPVVEPPAAEPPASPLAAKADEPLTPMPASPPPARQQSWNPHSDTIMGGSFDLRPSVGSIMGLGGIDVDLPAAPPAKPRPPKFTPVEPKPVAEAPPTDAPETEAAAPPLFATRSDPDLDSDLDDDAPRPGVIDLDDSLAPAAKTPPAAMPPTAPPMTLPPRPKRRPMRVGFNGNETPAPLVSPFAGGQTGQSRTIADVLIGSRNGKSVDVFSVPTSVTEIPPMRPTPSPVSEMPVSEMPGAEVPLAPVAEAEPPSPDHPLPPDIDIDDLVDHGGTRHGGHAPVAPLPPDAFAGAARSTDALTGLGPHEPPAATRFKPRGQIRPVVPDGTHANGSAQGNGRAAHAFGANGFANGTPAPFGQQPLSHQVHPQLAAADRRRRHLRRAIVLISLTVVIVPTLVWLFLKYWPQAPVKVQASLGFPGLARLSDEDRNKFRQSQDDLLFKPDVFSLAVDLLPPGVTPGFLGAEPAARSLAFERNPAQRWNAESPETLRIRIDSTDPLADRDRLEALARAVQKRNEPLNSLAATLRSQDESNSARLDQLKKRIDGLRTELVSVKQRAEAAISDQSLPEIEQAALAADLTARGARADVHELEDLFKRLSEQGPTTRPAVDVAVALANDEEAKKLTKDLAKFTARIERVNTKSNDDAGKAREVLDAAVQAFQKTLDGTQGKLQDSPEMARYVASAKKYFDTTRDLIDDLVRQLDAQRTELTDVKAMLDIQSEQQRKEVFAKDPALSELSDRFAIYDRQYNAAVAAGLEESQQAKSTKRDLELVSDLIKERRKVLGANSPFASAIGKVQDAIDRTEEKTKTTRANIEKTLADTQQEFLAAAPAIDQLPAEQKAVAESLETKLAAINDARKQYNQLIDDAAANAAAEADAARTQLAETQTKLDLRKREVVATLETQAVASAAADRDKQRKAVGLKLAAARTADTDAADQAEKAATARQVAVANRNALIANDRRRAEIEAELAAASSEQAVARNSQDSAVASLAKSINPDPGPPRMDFPDGQGKAAEARQTVAFAGGGGLVLLMLVPIIWSLVRAGHEHPLSAYSGYDYDPDPHSAAPAHGFEPVPPEYDDAPEETSDEPAGVR